MQKKLFVKYLVLIVCIILCIGSAIAACCLPYGLIVSAALELTKGLIDLGNSIAQAIMGGDEPMTEIQKLQVAVNEPDTAFGYLPKGASVKINEFPLIICDTFDLDLNNFSISKL